MATHLDPHFHLPTWRPRLPVQLPDDGEVPQHLGSVPALPCHGGLNINRGEVDDAGGNNLWEGGGGGGGTGVTTDGAQGEPGANVTGISVPHADALRH